MFGRRRYGLGDSIKHAREEKGLSQRELAEKLGVSDTIVSCWETGRKRPSADNLFRLRDTIGLNLNNVRV